MATELAEVRDVLAASSAPSACLPDAGSRLAYAYCLPKVHKACLPVKDRLDYVRALKWRPVVSSVTAPTANLQRWLTRVLWPIYIAMSPEHVSDPLDVVERQLQVGDGESVLSLDVNNMFGTVPVDETIALVLSKWDDLCAAEHCVTRAQLESLLRLVSRPMFIAPNGAIYRQEVGFPMGGPASPVLCMMYVTDILRRAALKVTWVHRYVDDVLACLCNGYTALQAIEDLCKADASGSVTWTHELPASHCPAPPLPHRPVHDTVPFLDLLVSSGPGPVNFLPYRKPCAVSRVAHRSSAVEPSHCSAWARSMLDRYTRHHCGGDRAAAVHAMMSHLRSVSARHGYSPSWLASVVRAFLSDTPKRDFTGVVFVSLPPWLSIPYLRSLLAKIEVRVATTGRPASIGAMFNSRRRAPHVGGPVVYAYRCRTCMVVYVGETTDPARRHMAHDYAGSRVAMHHASHPQHVFDTPVVLARPYKKPERLVFECVFGRAVPSSRSLNAADADFDPSATELERTRSGALKRLDPLWWMVLSELGVVDRAWRRVRVAFGELAPPAPTSYGGLPSLPPFPDTLASLMPFPSPPPRIPLPRLAAVVHDLTRTSTCIWCLHPFAAAVRCERCVNYLCHMCAGGVKRYICDRHGGAHVVDGVQCRSSCDSCPAVIPLSADSVMCDVDECPAVLCPRCLAGRSAWRCRSHGPEPAPMTPGVVSRSSPLPAHPSRMAGHSRLCVRSLLHSPVPSPLSFSDLPTPARSPRHSRSPSAAHLPLFPHMQCDTPLPLRPPMCLKRPRFTQSPAHTCGMGGGRTLSGLACGRKVRSRGSRCNQHTRVPANLCDICGRDIPSADNNGLCGRVTCPVNVCLSCHPDVEVDWFCSNHASCAGPLPTVSPGCAPRHACPTRLPGRVPVARPPPTPSRCTPSAPLSPPLSGCAVAPVCVPRPATTLLGRRSRMSPPLDTPPRAFMAREPAVSPVAPLHVVGNRAAVCRSVFGVIPPMLVPGKPRRDLYKVRCRHPLHVHLWSTPARASCRIVSELPGRCSRGMCRFCCYVSTFYSDDVSLPAVCEFHGRYPKTFPGRMPRAPEDIRRVPCTVFPPSHPLIPSLPPPEPPPPPPD